MKLSVTLLLTLVSTTALAAMPESLYVKKATWVESMLATRAALKETSQVDITLSSWRESRALAATTLDDEPAGKDPVDARRRDSDGRDLFSRATAHGIAPVKTGQALRPRTIQYLQREISLPKATECELQIQGDAAVVVWLNNARLDRREESAAAANPRETRAWTIVLPLRAGTNRLLIKTFASRAGRLVVDLPAARFDTHRVADELFRHFWEDFAETDWFAQDAPEHQPGETNARRDFGWYFAPGRTADAEQKMIRRVLEEVGPLGGKLNGQLAELVAAGCDVQDPRWLTLYVDACRLRRQARVRAVEQRCPQFIFTRHATMGGSHYAYTEGQSDAQAERHFTPGSALCLATMRGGDVRCETLVDDPHGIIRDPDVSYDARRVLFAWKRSDRLDDYHLHELDLERRTIRQLTFGLGVADYEAAYLPGGDILFNSTRCVQTVDCWWTEVSNLYRCDGEGRRMRRLTFDQVHDNFPTVTEDGRILYTRWEYNDRGQIYPQPLLQMNPDGTNQAGFYGVNSWFPTTILHARNIPGTKKVMAIATGHHSRQTGKLIVIDPSRGREENEGAQLVAPVRETPAVKVDSFGQEGELFQYPYPLDEGQCLAAWHPMGWAWSGRYGPRFAVYWFATDGRRERLVDDAVLPCGQPIPLRPRSGGLRPVQVDYRHSDATCYIQNVYAGPGLAGIAPGAVKRLRVVELDFRAAGIGANSNGGPGGGAMISTPVAIGNGAWDPKIILGDATVYEDGSAMFRVPARTPIYFQLLDERGRMVQSMRSWTSLQPGENASCVGCHEHKNQTPQSHQPSTIAVARGVEKLRPVGDGRQGFSFRRQIQPMLDQKCVSCHNGDPKKLPDLRGEEVADTAAKRTWTTSYLALTHSQPSDRKERGARWRGDPDHPVVNWISAQSAPPMLPPLSAGSNCSKLISLLEAGHEKVQVTASELEKLSAWIDLGVPFAGDYREGAAWTPEEIAKYDYYLSKRKHLAAGDAESVARLAEAGAAGKPASEESVAALAIEIMGRDGKVVSAKRGQAALTAPLVLASPRPFEAGDRIRISGAQHVALQIGTGMPEALIYSPGSAVEYAVPCTTSPVKPGATPYPPQAFDEKPPRITARPAARRELGAYRNLARNPYDLAAVEQQFPHAAANSECRHEAVFAARNAIDGWTANQRHGGWPYQSWGPEKQKDLWWQVDFGREVDVDRVTVYLRADFPHDKHWHHAVLVFSDGQRMPLTLEKTDQPQTVKFPSRRTTSLRLADLVSDEPLGWCALAELEAWGCDAQPAVEDRAKAAESLRRAY